MLQRSPTHSRPGTLGVRSARPDRVAPDCQRSDRAREGCSDWGGRMWDRPRPTSARAVPRLAEGPARGFARGAWAVARDPAKAGILPHSPRAAGREMWRRVMAQRARGRSRSAAVRALIAAGGLLIALATFPLVIVLLSWVSRRCCSRYACSRSNSTGLLTPTPGWFGGGDESQRGIAGYVQRRVGS